jgi:hypothetical protein
VKKKRVSGKLPESGGATAAQPLFVRIVLSAIWKVYEAEGYN